MCMHSGGNVTIVQLSAKRLGEHAVQELKRIEEAWQLRWAGESARLKQLHGDELAATAIKHRQVCCHMLPYQGLY